MPPDTQDAEVTQVAFGLKYSIDDLSGLTCAGHEGETLDVKAMLDEGNGTIVAEDPKLIEVLRGVEVLVEVPVPSGPGAPTPQPTPPAPPEHLTASGTFDTSEEE